MNATLTLHRQDSTTLTLSACLKFSLLLERYTPYSTLRASFVCDDTDNLSDVCRAVFRLDGRCLHDGIMRDFKIETAQNRRILHVTSRSFMEVLLHNQLVPGLHTNVTLYSLMNAYALPHITYETSVSATNYIYVKENTGMWDAISAYNYKYNHNVPYVNFSNYLRMNPKQDTPTPLPVSSLVSFFEGGNTSAVLSRIDMADVDGTYGTFTLSNPDAAAREIVRVKQIAFDKQFAASPMDALRYRIALGNRRLKQKSVTYFGYCGEDIEDYITCGNYLSGHISRMRIIGTPQGVQTTDTLYFDSFCNPISL